MIGGSWLLDRWLTMPISEGDSLWWSGVWLAAVAALLALVTLLQFLRAKTHVEPWQPTTTIIQSGVYRYSRNPIYLAFCLATAACGMLLNSWWILAAVLPLAYLLQILVIHKEEVYLEAKFGQSYLDFKNQVRRWL
jgi:protein-S-isoprenylcysteine O-methyltransferase Ste14